MEKEQKQALLRIAVSAVLFAAACLLPLTGIPRLAAFLIPYAVCGWEVVWDALRNLFRGELLDEKFLMTAATAGAFALGEYPEGVAVMLLYQVGEWFEDMAVDRSRRSISELMDIRPDSAVVLRDGGEQKVAPQEVAVGETIRVLPGERIPLDGTVLTGSSSLDVSALTGESLPADVQPGSTAVSGSVNLTGALTVKVTRAYGESTVSKILDLVENSAARKARAENFITKFAHIYTPCVVAGAVLLAVLPPLLAGRSWSEWIGRALVFLVVSCPCALVISVPLTFFGGIGCASREGILIKGSNYMETLSGLKTVVFDKTGTLTKGVFSVAAIHPECVSEAELLDLAAAAESLSHHPIAESIVAAHGGHLDESRVASVTELAGLGLKAVIDGRTIFVGNGKLMEQAGAKWHECEKPGTVIHLSAGSEYLGHIVISDEAKPDAKEALAELKKLGTAKTVMLTGDRKDVGEAVGRELGIDEVQSGLLPADKVAAVEKMLPENSPLAFVGDGINDAPVLSRADLGIAMGALGSDAAIEAADVVLMDDKPSKIARAVVIARRTLRIVRQNVVFSLAVKAVVLVLGALGLAGMWVAVFADVGVLILATLNAARALHISKKAA